MPTSRHREPLLSKPGDGGEDDGERGVSFWLVGALVVGSLVGLFVPMGDPTSGASHTIPPHCKAPTVIKHGRLSFFLGWVSFCAWSISFYPQIFLNYRLKHTNGLSTFYQLMNIAGYAAYSIYNGFFYISPNVQSQFCLQHSGNMNAVRLSDLLFSWHACCLTWVTVSQIVIYNGDKRTGAISFVILICLIALTLFMGSSLPYLYSLGTFKIVVTLIKYVPQAVLNYRRQSTVGWTIHNVLLDFTGGVCSVAQLFIDAGSWALVVSNFPKLGLGLISMFFDCIFFFQHYCLYNRAAGSTELLVEETDEKSRIILPESINV